jgi:hypothetical protein
MRRCAATELLDASGLTRAAFEPGTKSVEVGELWAPNYQFLVLADATFTSHFAMTDLFGANHGVLVEDFALTSESPCTASVVSRHRKFAAAIDNLC